MYHTPWLIKLSHKVAELTKPFYINRHDDEAFFVQNKIVQSTNNVHRSLRICNTFFTALVLVGSEEKYASMNIHKDSDEYDMAIVNFGTDGLKGGYTVYYNSMHPKDCGKIQEIVPFKHGRIQIGNFSKVYHGVSPYIGP